MEVLRIKDILKEKGISAVKFSNDLNLSYPYATNLLNNKHFPSKSLLIRISQYLDTDIPSLFYSNHDKSEIKNQIKDLLKKL